MKSAKSFTRDFRFDPGGVGAYAKKLFAVLWRCIIKGNRVSEIKETRTVVAGVVNKGDGKKTNRITTSKYTIITFIPKNLLEQFRRLANFYFLIVSVIAVVIDSPVSPFTTLSPLVFVILVTMAKQGFEDWLRHRADDAVNNELVYVIRNSTLHRIKCHEIRPGELIKITRDSDVPCDAVLMWTSDSRGKCFVTTANLDGETSLKALKVPSTVVNTGVGDVASMNINIEYLPPEADIYTFYGKFQTIGNKTVPIGTENLLLRGSRVKNTEWAIGCAIYTGKETKLALNSKFRSNKFSSSEVYVNKFLIFYIVVMVAEILISYGLKKVYESINIPHEVYLGPETSNYGVLSMAQDLLSFLLLYYYCIPISLYVTIEMHKFIGSMYFAWDNDLYSAEYDQQSLVNTSDLNEELGQIEILFSDKTGTLTKNDMYFRMCSIRGELYIERDEKLYEFNEDLNIGDFTNAREASNPDAEFFFSILALCHTVQVEDEPATFVDKSSPGMPSYQAMSADEIAFVKAAARYGIVFDGDDVNELVLRHGDKLERYERLNTIEFTSTRRRMSVIVRTPEGKIFLFCKGADSAVLPLCLDSDLIGTTSAHVQRFAQRGFRTLVVAYKELTEDQYASIADEINRFNTDLTRRHDQNNYDQWRAIENDLTVLGATAVEDRLQDDVAETMTSIRDAGITIWVLTGDKVETAINVSQSCGHIPHESQKLFLTDIYTSEDLQPQLSECILAAKVADKSHLTLVVDGQSVQLLFGAPQEGEFVAMALKCAAVICCRLSPLQKSQIVKLVKESSGRPVTAAIGDGANDVSMIQEAHLGFGIFGKEGRQAARAADFSFANFNMLKKTFLVHGHWYYQRFATLIQYSFYKNLLFVNLMLFNQIFSCFSTQINFDSYFLTFYNLLFASAPILVISLTEKCHSEEELMNNPSLYKRHKGNKLLSWKYFYAWSVAAIYHSVIVYFFLYALWEINQLINADGKAASMWCHGTATFHCLVLIVNLKIWLHGKYQTVLFIGFILITLVGFAIFTAIYSYFNFIDDGDMIGVYWRLLGSFNFWMANILIVVASFLPDYTFMYLRSVYVCYDDGRKKNFRDDLELTYL